jgi:hypothetical protein
MVWGMDVDKVECVQQPLWSLTERNLASWLLAAPDVRGAGSSHGSGAMKAPQQDTNEHE